MENWQFWTLMTTIILFSLTPIVFWTNALAWVKKHFIKKTTIKEKEHILNEVRVSLKELANNKKGATIIIDVQQETNNYIVDSTELDSIVSAELITNIFEGTKTPLHDGAVVISGNRISKAAAYITKLSDKKLPKKYGTRHRSAIGIAEATNVISIVLSEETGAITVSHHGEWNTVSQNDLTEYVLNIWNK